MYNSKGLFFSLNEVALENIFTKKDPNPQKLYTPSGNLATSRSIVFVEIPSVHAPASEFSWNPPSKEDFQKFISNSIETFADWYVGTAEKLANSILSAWDWIKKNPPVKIRTYYKESIKSSPFYKEAYFSHVNVSNSIYSDKNNASFAKQVYQMWASYNPAPHPGFVNPKINKPPVDSGWGKESWKNRAEQFKKEAKDFFSAERWKNIGIDMGVNFAADILASSLTYGGYNVNKKRTSNIITTDPYPVNKETGKFLYGSKGESHFSLLQPSIGKFKISSTFQPVMFNNIFSYELKKVDNKLSCTTWLISPDTNVLKPAKFNYEPAKKSTHPINLLHARGPDLLSHKFTMYITFLYNTGFQKEIEDDNFTDFQSTILKNPGFSVRVGSLSIPSIVKETFDIDYLGTKVTKNRSSLIMNNQATISFRLDQNLMWLNYFDNMAGHNNTIDSISYSGSSKSDDNRFKNLFMKNGREDWKTTINYITNSWNFVRFKGVQGPVKIMITCKITDLTNSDFLEQTDSLPYIIFDDVKFLGTNSSINYEREGSSTQAISVDFIYKKLYEIYPVVSSKGKQAETVKEAEEPMQLDIIPEWQFLQLQQYKKNVEKQETQIENDIMESIKKNKLKIFSNYIPQEFASRNTVIDDYFEQNQKTNSLFKNDVEEIKKQVAETKKEVLKREPPKIPPFFIPLGGK